MAHLVKYETRQYLKEYEVSAQKERKGNSFSHESFHHSWTQKKTVQPHSVPSKAFFHWVREKNHRKMDPAIDACLLLIEAGTWACPCQHTGANSLNFRRCQSPALSTLQTLCFMNHRGEVVLISEGQNLWFSLLACEMSSPLLWLQHVSEWMWHKVEWWAPNSCSFSYLLHGLGQVTSIFCGSSSPYVNWCYYYLSKISGNG